ncbi:MAG: aspartate aminotransferase family protein [Thaumarchaeota archaeon]|nr:aspartate aminotransferase family protein [Nitrososphaerota archaeon]
MQLENSKVDPELLEHMFLDFMQMKEFAKDPVIIKSASGVWYEDINGKKYLDGISGIFTVNVGHGNRRVIDAMKAQLEEITFAPPLHSTNLRALELTKLVSQLMPGDLHTLKFFSGGSESTEAAMKLARQYHKQTGNPGKYKVISRYESYHGATMGSLAASGVSKRKTPFEPFGTGYVHVFPPTCYRCPYGLQYPECGVLCATIIEKVVKQEDPSTVSAIIVEPIGNTGGVVTPPLEYFKIIREICDKYNILLIHDEIITGFGRTGEMFASQTFKTTPDIICMGKGMSSGYAPVGAIAISDRIAQAFYGRGDENKQFNHGHTFGANPLSAAAAIASVSEIKDRNLPEKGKKAGERVWRRLEEMKSLGIVGDIRGKGLFIGVEFVKNPGTKEQFADGLNLGLKIGKIALKKGLFLRSDPHWIAFAPPLIISDDEVDTMMDIFSESTKEALATVR